MGADVARAAVYVPPELPWANCSGAIGADSTVIEARALPENGATVTAGTPVTFSTSSDAPVTFSVASSPALLASPDIDQGLARSLAPEGGETRMQAFTSTKAAASPGIVYWQASFSADEVPGCAGVLSGIVAVPPRTLTVEPAPPSPLAPLLAAPPPPLAFSATISAAHANRPRVAFQVQCSTSCLGTAAYVVTVTQHHAKRRAHALDFGPWRVSIASISGGVQRFAHRYTGAALRVLERLIRGGGALEAQITSTLTDANGDKEVARATTRLG
jgi:hypothetical protein